MAEYEKVVETLERTLKTGDAPIGKHWGCLLSMLDVKETLGLIKSLKSELKGKVEYIDEVSEEYRRAKAEAERLEYTLLGVMNSVDKWLDDEELEQNEVNRASAMREKLLRIIEDRDAKIDALIAGQETLQKYIAEKNVEIEKLKKKLSLAECCICDIEDALNRGSDNDWAREHIEDYEKEVAAID